MAHWFTGCGAVLSLGTTDTFYIFFSFSFFLFCGEGKPFLLLEHIESARILPSFRICANPTISKHIQISLPLFLILFSPDNDQQHFFPLIFFLFPECSLHHTLHPFIDSFPFILNPSNLFMPQTVQGRKNENKEPRTISLEGL